MPTKWEILRAASTLGDGFAAWDYLNNLSGSAGYIYGELPLQLPSDILLAVEYPVFEVQLGGEIQLGLPGDYVIEVRVYQS